MIDNEEILNRFDVLYNNIMSNSAPGLDAYEKSVFWNKATLEVLKNHLNPKGNKYTEGFDFSSKRQIEFSKLVKTDVVLMKRDDDLSTYNIDYWTIDSNDFNFDNVLSIINERIQTIDINTYASILKFIDTFPNLDVTDINDVTSTLNYILKGLPKDHPMASKLMDIVNAGRDVLLYGKQDADGTYTPQWIKFEQLIAEYRLPPTIYTTIEDMEITNRVNTVVIVPVNNVEYDTLSSRPYPYPPKSQAWRIITESKPEFVLNYGMAPVDYYIRYVKIPKDVNLADNTDIPEIPEQLYDEILQRAVELAKNSWEGTLETHKTFGERSE